MVDAQQFVDDVIGIATGKTFEKKGMVAEADGEAGSAVSMGWTTAHAVIASPDAAELPDKLRTHGLKCRIPGTDRRIGHRECSQVDSRRRFRGVLAGRRLPGSATVLAPPPL